MSLAFNGRLFLSKSPFLFQRDGMIGLQDCGPVPPKVPPSHGGRSRERTAQAVEFYNNHVQKARANAGLTSSTVRSSYSDHHPAHNTAPRRYHNLSPEILSRSNSSLELLDHHAKHTSDQQQTAANLKREYGSHGSINALGDRPQPIAGTNEAFFDMLKDYRPAVLGGVDQRSPGPSEYLKGKFEGASDYLGNCDESHATPQSPKLRVKLPRFLGGSGSVSGANSIKHPKQTMDDSAVNVNCAGVTAPSAESEEIAKRRAFAHYDCQSLTTNLTYSVRMRKNLLAKRRNTTTGASAASMIARSSTPDGENGEEDIGDGNSNDLVQSCPFFRNEIGGEEERMVSLTRVQGSNVHQNGGRRPLHRPALAYGVAVLEFKPGETHWRHSTCPYQRLPRPIESIDQGALYYRSYFKGQGK